MVAAWVPPRFNLDDPADVKEQRSDGCSEGFRQRARHDVRRRPDKLYETLVLGSKS